MSTYQHVLNLISTNRFKSWRKTVWNSRCIIDVSNFYYSVFPTDLCFLVLFPECGTLITYIAVYIRYDYLRRGASNPAFRIFFHFTFFSIFRNTPEILTFNLYSLKHNLSQARSKHFSINLEIICLLFVADSSIV